MSNSEPRPTAPIARFPAPSGEHVPSRPGRPGQDADDVGIVRAAAPGIQLAGRAGKPGPDRAATAGPGEGRTPADRRTSARREDYDAVIVGARCAGAATAMLLARQGWRVLAVDRGRYGGDTLSTHALMRGGVLQLHRWGLLERLAAAGTPPTRSTTFHYGDEAIEIPIKPRDGIAGLYSPRRTVLDALLVDAARESGAEVRHETQVLDLLRGAGGRVTGIVTRGLDGAARPIRAGIVIGADGLRSLVARRVNATAYRVARHRTSVVYGYWHGVGIEGNHWYYRPGVSAGAIPTNHGATCVFASVPPRRFEEEIRKDPAAGHRRVLAECDARLASAVDAAVQEGKLFAFAGVPGQVRQSWGPGWALVGDAAYFKDPLTAHGITDALRDAELLSAALARGGEPGLVGYQAQRDALSLGLFEVTDEVAGFGWDLPTIQQLHLRLSEEMNREVEALTALGPAPRPATARRSA